MTPERRQQVQELLSRRTNDACVVWSGVVDSLREGVLVHAMVAGPHGLIQSGNVNQPGFELHYHDVSVLSHLVANPGRIVEVLDDGLYENPRIAGGDIAGKIAMAMANEANPGPGIAAFVLRDARTLLGAADGRNRRLLIRQIILAKHLQTGAGLPGAEEWRDLLQNPPMEFQGLVRGLNPYMEDRQQMIVIQNGLAQIERAPHGEPRLPAGVVNTVITAMRTEALAARLPALREARIEVAAIPPRPIAQPPPRPAIQPPAPVITPPPAPPIAAAATVAATPKPAVVAAPAPPAAPAPSKHAAPPATAMPAGATPVATSKSKKKAKEPAKPGAPAFRL